MLPIFLIILVSANNLHSATVTKKSTDVIRFPDVEVGVKKVEKKPVNMQPATLTNKFGDNDVPEKCRNLNYCTEKPADYPDELFNELFKDFKIPPMPAFDPLGNKQGDIDYNDDCLSEVSYDPIYKVRSKREEPWRFVVQAPERDYVQRVRLEECKDSGKTCFKPFLVASSYDTACHQTFNTWEVLVKNDDNTTELIKAELPVCCSCKYKHRSFTTRFNPIDTEEDSNDTKQKNI